MAQPDLQLGAVRRPKWCAGVVGMMLLATSASATTYYVRAGGDDTQDGLTPATAFASIRPAARLLRAPGDRLVVGPGVYREGNIAPFGNGSPDAPIVLFGDSSGALTGDAPGPVSIIPPNTPRATTGFIVYGRTDIVIQGFDTGGARDAGIQVRARRRTGADSTRIALIENTVRDGIQITAAGALTVDRNRLIGNGLSVQGGASGPVAPTITRNSIAQSPYGLSIDGSVGGIVAANEIQSIARTVRTTRSDALRIDGNVVHGPGCFGISSSNLEIADNTFDQGGEIDAAEALDLTRNRIGSNLLIRSDGMRATATENQLAANLYVAGGGGRLDFERNDVNGLQGEGLDAILAVDNHFANAVKIKETSSAEIGNNQAAMLAARATDSVICDNQIATHLTINAERATVARNTAQSLSVGRLDYSGRVPTEDAVALVEGNVSRSTLIVGAGARAEVQDNVAAGQLTARAPREVHVTRNDTGGLECVLYTPDSVAVVTENRARNSLGPGILVVGAHELTLERNEASLAADSGLVLRRTGQAAIADNLIQDNVGGISLRVELPGDCNDDVQVTIDELITAVGIAMGARSVRDCDAVDADANHSVSVAELVLAVGSALEPFARPSGVTEMRANDVLHNGRFGIDILTTGPVLAIGNRITDNSHVGLAVHGRGLPDQTEVLGNVIGSSGADGLLLSGVGGARVRDNVIFGNRRSGVLLRNAPGVSVVNNLVYDNAKHGIAVGLGPTRPSVGAVLMNNTVYANHQIGIAVGASGAPSTGAIVRDNIVSGNRVGGIAASMAAFPGLTIGFNLNTDGYGEDVLPGMTDLAADPQFVAPAGADGVLGGAGFADDDFHLQPTSPAIDAGEASAAALGITGSAVAGQVGDAGIVDLGYHYGADEPGP